MADIDDFAGLSLSNASAQQAEVTAATFDSFLSWNGSVWEPRTPLHLATEKGPDGDLGHIEGPQRAALDDFVLQRRKIIPTRREYTPSKPVYKALYQGEIRIIELYKGDFGTELQGRLHVACIDFEYPKVGNWQRHTHHAISLETGDRVWFTALSYVWGVGNFEVAFKLGDSAIGITATLSSALQHLRLSDQSVWLWIDQICINQTDIREKEHQIPLMGKIYSHATSCIIWLGEEGGDSPTLAFETLQTVHARLQLSDEKITATDFGRLALPDPMNIAWWEVKQLFRRPWFTRLWTIQEVVLPSSDVHVQCGKAVILWEELARCCATLESCGLLQWLTSNAKLDQTYGHQREPAEFKPATGGSTIISLDAERRLTYQNVQSLLNILVGTRYAQATEPKDKVYGILGLVNVDIKPTYAKSVTTRQVYFEASTKVRSEELFRLFHCVDHETPMRPSWVPDWGTPRVTESLGYTNTSWAIYAAGGKNSDPERGFKYPFIVPLEVEYATQSALVSGRLFEEITALGIVVTDPLVDIDSPTDRNRAWVSYVDLASSFARYPSGATVFDAFWQTLVAGKDASGHERAPNDYSEVFSLVLDSSTGQMPSLPGQVYSPRRQKGFFTLNSLRSRKPAQVLDDLRISFRAAMRYRRFAVTSKGYFALVPRGSAVGDRICVLEGVNVPFVMRNAADEKNSFELVGECYVHGIMEGEIMDLEEYPLQTIRLV